MGLAQAGPLGTSHLQADPQSGKQQMYAKRGGRTGGARWPATTGSHTLRMCSLASGQPHDGSSRVVPVIIGMSGLRLEWARKAHLDAVQRSPVVALPLSEGG
jgi:hypothetical protein